LDVAGELRWPVPALSVPDPHRPLSVGGLEGYESTRLFAERAQRRNPAFTLTPQNMQTVAEICRRLEGIPLAIELAAVRVGALPVEQIAERLGDSLGFLTGGGRMTPPRQQTLRGTMDWSYQLLAEPEQKLFRRLSVFTGGLTLGAAEAVGEGDGIEEGDVLELLSRLVEKSLVVIRATEEGGLRYGMLEPIRQYAREKLVEVSVEAEAIRRRHANFFLALAEEAEPRFRGPGATTSLGRLETEHDNIRAALSWLLESGEAELGLRLGATLLWFWSARGYWSEGARWLEEALAKDVAAEPATRAGTFSGLGVILVHIQSRCLVMRYSGNHEASNLCTFAFRQRARGTADGSALQRRFRSTPSPDTSCKCSRRTLPTDSQELGMQLADGARRHPRLQPARSRCPQGGFLTPEANPRYIRGRKSRGSARVAPPFS
jgi:predicted ATPase